jgi:hypothetical protein
MQLKLVDASFAGISRDCRDPAILLLPADVHGDIDEPFA